MRELTFSLAALGLIAGAVCLVYGPAIHSPFIHDDLDAVLENPSIVRLWPLVDSERSGPLNPPHNLPTSGRPLVNLSLALNYYFGQFNPVGYHLFNLVVHLLSAMLLMAIVRRTLRLDYFGGRFDRASLPLACLVALLWAVHPLQTETVIYVTQRTELLVGFFYLATLYGSLGYWAATSPAGRTGWLTISTLACLAGMASKEVMVTAPVVVLLFERTFISGSFRQALRRSWPLYLGLALGWALLLALNYDAPRSNSAGFHRSVSADVWWLTQTKVLWMYLKLAVWPWPLTMHYQIAYLNTPAAAWPWLLAAALLAVGVLVLLGRRNPIGFVGAWVLLILLPTLVVPIVTEVAAERRMYLPLAALTTLAVVGGYALVQQVVKRVATSDTGDSTRRWPLAITGAATLILALVFSLVSARRLEAYHDSVTLWQDVLATQPNDDVAHNCLAIALIETNQLPQAIEHLQQALSIEPDYAEAHSNLGIAMTRMGKLEEAADQFRQAIRSRPGRADFHNNLGNVLADTGHLPQAIAEYQQAVQLQPDYAFARYNLGNALVNSGQSAAAIQQYQQALQIKPDFVEAHGKLGDILAQTDPPQQAYEHYRQVVRLKPDDIQAYVKLAMVSARLRRTSEAIASAQKALDLSHSSGQIALARKIEQWISTYRTQQSPTKNTAAPDRPAGSAP